MLTRRGEALRRLGGPVCPVCDVVGAEGVEVVFLSSDGSEWLKGRGKGVVERQSLAPMCASCYRGMNQAVADRHAAAAEQRAAADLRATMDNAYLNTLNGPKYREACAEHEDDLAAAEAMANEWGVGNGLFGSRGE